MKISKYLANNKKRKRRMFWSVFSIVALVSTLVVFITFYGLSTGNFYIGIDSTPESKNISISLEPRSTDNKKLINLFHNHLQSPGQFELIRSELPNILKEDGKYEGELKDNLIATSFYIRNLNNNLGVNLKYQAISTDDKKEFLKPSAWTMLLVYDDEYHIYNDSSYDKTIYPSSYQVHEYKNSISIFENYIFNLDAGVEKRISIVIWNNGAGESKPEPFQFKLYFQATDKDGGDI